MFNQSPQKGIKNERHRTFKKTMSEKFLKLINDVNS